MNITKIRSEALVELLAHLESRATLSTRLPKFLRIEVLDGAPIWWGALPAFLLRLRTPAEQRARATKRANEFRAMARAADDLVGAALPSLWRRWGVSPTIVDDLKRIRDHAARQATALQPAKKNGRPRNEWRDELEALIAQLYADERVHPDDWRSEGGPSRASDLHRAKTRRIVDRLIGAPRNDLRLRRDRAKPTAR